MKVNSTAVLGAVLVLLCGSRTFAAHYEKASITDKSDDGTEWIVDSADRGTQNYGS